jgi:hypothetical protein
MSDVLLLEAVQAWCDECGGVRILVPAPDEIGVAGYCCTVCDAAVFGVSTSAEVESRRDVSLPA